MAEGRGRRAGGLGVRSRGVDELVRASAECLLRVWDGEELAARGADRSRDGCRQGGGGGLRQSGANFQGNSLPNAKLLEPNATRDREGRALGEGLESTIRRDLDTGRSHRWTRALRGCVLRARRNGEPNQRAAARSLRRPDVRGDDESESTEAVALVDCIRRDE